MSESMSGSELARIAGELLALGRAERAIIDDGRLEELVPLAERRGELVAALDSSFPGTTLLSPAIRETLRLVRLEGQENLSRLRIAQADIANRLSDNATAGRAVAGYGSASKY